MALPKSNVGSGTAGIEKLVSSQPPPATQRIIISLSGAPNTNKTLLSYLIQYTLASVTDTYLVHQSDFCLPIDSPKLHDVMWQSPSDRALAIYTADNAQTSRCGGFETEMKSLWSVFHEDVLKSGVRLSDLEMTPGAEYFYRLPTIEGERVRRLFDEREARGERRIQNRCGKNLEGHRGVDWGSFATTLRTLKAGGPVAQDNQTRICSLRKSFREVDRILITRMQEQLLRSIHDMTKLNEKVGFGGQYVRNGKLRSIGIVEGNMLQGQPDGEKRMNTMRNLMGAMMKASNINMFMPAKRCVVREKRFTNNSKYKDVVDGGTRHTEEHWKTEEYFDGVVWNQYVTDHSWLFQDGDVEMARGRGTSERAKRLEIHLREISRQEPDVELQKDLEWAYDIILHSLVASEAAARHNFVESLRAKAVKDRNARSVSKGKGVGTNPNKILARARGSTKAELGVNLEAKSSQMNGTPKHPKP